MAKRAGSGVELLLSRGAGTGMYVLILECRDCFWMPCSGMGAEVE